MEIGHGGRRLEGETRIQQRKRAEEGLKSRVCGTGLCDLITNPKSGSHTWFIHNATSIHPPTRQRRRALRTSNSVLRQRTGSDRRRQATATLMTIITTILIHQNTPEGPGPQTARLLLPDSLSIVITLSSTQPPRGIPAGRW